MMLIMLSEEGVRPKVSAFVTRSDGRLLVFAHPDSPDAGIQVPAGGIDPDSEPLPLTPDHAAVFRRLRDDLAAR